MDKDLFELKQLIFENVKGILRRNINQHQRLTAFLGRLVDETKPNQITDELLAKYKNMASFLKRMKTFDFVKQFVNAEEKDINTMNSLFSNMLSGNIRAITPELLQKAHRIAFEWDNDLFTLQHTTKDDDDEKSGDEEPFPKTQKSTVQGKIPRAKQKTIKPDATKKLTNPSRHASTVQLEEEDEEMEESRGQQRTKDPEFTKYPQDTAMKMTDRETSYDREPRFASSMKKKPKIVARR